MSTEYYADEFLESATRLDQLMAEVDMPIVALGDVAIKRHLQLVPDSTPEPRSHEQQAAQYFGQSLFPSPLKPAS